MKKLVVRLDLHDDRAKQKALKTVSSLQGIDSISMDMKEKKMTVIGTVDPVDVVSKLRKYWHTDIVTVGPAKEPEKKEEPKKEDQQPKKEEAPKEEGKKEEQPKQEQKPAEELKKDEEPKKEEPKKEEQPQPKKEEEQKKPLALPPPDPVLELVRAYRAYNPQMTSYYYVQSMEENPNACVIC